MSSRCSTAVASSALTRATPPPRRASPLPPATAADADADADADALALSCKSDELRAERAPAADDDDAATSAASAPPLTVAPCLRQNARSRAYPATLPNASPHLSSN